MGQYLGGQGIVFPAAASGEFTAKAVKISSTIAHARVGVVGSVVNLVLGLIFVLGIPIPSFSGFGFVACPIVTTVTEICICSSFFMIAFVFFGLHRSTWDGFDRANVNRERILEYSKVYVPAALSSASDWWRVTVIGFIASTLGTMELAVFSVSYRIFWMTLTLVGALGSALGVRLSLYMGSGHVSKAKEALRVASLLCLTILFVSSAFVFWNVRSIAKIFSDDVAVVDTFADNALPLTLMLIFMNFSVYLERILTALGKTK
jgi:MATE family multidrug resistance protein